MFDLDTTLARALLDGCRLDDFGLLFHDLI